MRHAKTVVTVELSCGHRYFRRILCVGTGDVQRCVSCDALVTVRQVTTREVRMTRTVGNEMVTETETLLTLPIDGL